MHAFYYIVRRKFRLWDSNTEAFIDTQATILREQYGANRNSFYSIDVPVKSLPAYIIVSENRDRIDDTNDENCRMSFESMQHIQLP